MTSRTAWLLQLRFGWCNLALTAPSIYLWLGLPLLMRQQGWSGTAVGLFQLAGLPAVAKFLLAIPVERRGDASRSYRRWAVGLCAVQALALGGMAAVQGLRQPVLLFALALVTALAATWADVPVNALAIRLLPVSERPRAGAVRSAVTSLAAIIGGGLMLLVQARWGWPAPFVVMAGMLGVAACALAGLPDATAAPPASSAALPPLRQATPAQAWRSYLGAPGTVRWLAVLSTSFPFVAAAWFLLKPLLAAHGYGTEQAAWLAGVVGGLVAAAGGACAGWLGRRAGPGRVLPWLMVGSTLAMGLLAAAHAGLLPAWALPVAVLAVAGSMGAVASGLFALTMDHARPTSQALDYGLQASVFVATRIAVALLAGWALDRVGFDGVMPLLAACNALATLLAWRWWRGRQQGHHLLDENHSHKMRSPSGTS